MLPKKEINIEKTAFFDCMANTSMSRNIKNNGS